MPLNSKNILLIISTAIILFLSGCDRDASPQKQLDSAQTLFNAGKNSEAIIKLKNLLKQDSKNAHGRFLLGKLYVEQGKWQAAEKELTRAHEYHFDNNLTLPLLATIYYHLGDSLEIEEILNEESNLTDESKAIVKYYLASTFLNEGEQKKSIKEFKETIKTNANYIYSKLSNAWLLTQNKNYTEAQKTIDEIINKSPTLAIAYQQKGKILFLVNKMKLSAVAFNHYLKLRPEDHQTRLMYALTLANFSDFIEAEKQADFLLKISANNVLVNQIKAQSRFSDKDYKSAKEYAEVALRGKSDLLISQIIAGVSAYELKQPEVAYTHLVAIKDQLSFKHPARRLLTAIRFQLGYEDENYDDLSKAPIAELDSQLLSISAQELFKAGKVNEAEALMGKARELAPNDAKLIYQQGVLKLLRNNDEAIDFFKTALIKDPKIDSATSLLVVKLVENKKYKEALEIANKIKDRNPQLAFSLMGRIYFQQKNISAAKNSYIKVLALNENHIGALYNLALIEQHDNHLNDAIVYYEKILDVNSKHIPSIEALLKLSGDKKLSEQIRNYFERNIEASKESPAAIMSLTEYYLIHTNFNKAKLIVTKGLEASPSNTELLMLSAKVNVYLKSYDDSMIDLNKVLKHNPENNLIHAYKASLFFIQGDFEKAINEQVIAVEQNPNNTKFRLDLAKLYLNNGNLKLAKVQFKTLSKTQSTNIGVLELEGRLNFIEKKYKSAAKILAKVYNKAPSEKVLLELTTALQKEKKSLKAIKLIENLESYSHKKISVKILLKKAELYSEINPDKAIEIYTQLAEKTNGHYVMMNNLAWLYLKKGNLNKALENSRAAIQLAPKVISIQDTYGIVLLAMGSNIRALEILENVYKAKELKLNYRVHYAQALFANNYKTKAKDIIKGINKSDLDESTLTNYLNLIAQFKS